MDGIAEEDLGDGRVKMTFLARKKMPGWRGVAGLFLVLGVFLSIPAGCVSSLTYWGDRNPNAFPFLIASVVLLVGGSFCIKKLEGDARNLGLLSECIVISDDAVEARGERIRLSNIDFLSKKQNLITANVGGRVVLLANAKNSNIADALYLRITRRTGYTKDV